MLLVLGYGKAVAALLILPPHREISALYLYRPPVQDEDVVDAGVQQVAVVRRFVADLNLPVEVVMVPICREESGLARSSRNVYLSPAEREAALVLSRSLRKAKAAFDGGERSAERLKEITRAELATEPLARVDYVDLYTFPALQPVAEVTETSLLAIAVYIGKTRLIDNVIFTPSAEKGAAK